MSYEQVFPECPGMINDGKVWDDKKKTKLKKPHNQIKTQPSQQQQQKSELIFHLFL